MGQHSNLPPGVSVNDIPGNRPEDVDEEGFWEWLDRSFVDKYGEKAKRWLAVNEDIDTEEDLIYDYVRLARDIGYERGFTDGKADNNVDCS